MCKCGVEKQDKAVQVTAIAIDFRDGGQGQEGASGVNHGQYVGFDDAGEILYDVSRMWAKTRGKWPYRSAGTSTRAMNCDL